MTAPNVEMTCSSSSTADAQTYYLHVAPESASERYMRRSNEAADAARAAGCQGDWMLATALAELADQCAELASIRLSLELLAGRP